MTAGTAISHHRVRRHTSHYDKHHGERSDGDNNNDCEGTVQEMGISIRFHVVVRVIVRIVIMRVVIMRPITVTVSRTITGGMAHP